MKSTREREVYLYLFEHADADGFLTTSGVVISRELSIDSSTVCRHLRKLERRGEIYRLEDDERMTRYAVTAKVD